MEEGKAPEIEASAEGLIEAVMELPEAEAPSTPFMSGLGKAVLIAAADVSASTSSSASVTGLSSASSAPSAGPGSMRMIVLNQLMILVGCRLPDDNHSSDKRMIGGDSLYNSDFRIAIIVGLLSFTWCALSSPHPPIIEICVLTCLSFDESHHKGASNGT
jgi:hypothetical protein